MNCQTDRTFTTSSVPGAAAIAFSSNRAGNSEIHSIAADGSGVANLTGNAAFDDSAAWSADATQVAFTSFRGYDEPHERPRVRQRAHLSDGSAIAFGSGRDGNAEVYVMDADGGNPANLTNNSAADGKPAWSQRPASVGT